MSNQIAKFKKILEIQNFFKSKNVIILNEKNI